MLFRADALILAVRPHGEHGAVVRAFSGEGGMRPGYVRGARSRALRPVLQPGNRVLAAWRARTDEQLAALEVELVESRAALHREPLAAAALDWLCVLSAAALPEGQPYPRLHATLSAVIDAIAAAAAARDWAAAIARYELLLLAELGFGLDLTRCVVSGGTDDLAWVSPRSGGAVSRGAGAAHADRLLPLPGFLREGGSGSGQDILDALALTRHFVARDILVDRRAGVFAARERLVDRLRAAVA